MIVFIGKDKGDGEKIRAGERLRHRAMINALKKNNLVCFAGPFISDMGNIAGSLVIFKTRDMELVREIMSLDPYVRAGLFSAREISRLTTYSG